MLPSFYRADGHLSPASGKWAPSSNALASQVRWRLASALRKSDHNLEHARTSRCSRERSTALELAQKKGRTRRPLLSIGQKGWLGPIQD